MKIDLVATCWTTSGEAYPETGFEVSPIPLQTRIEEAASAGFRGVGLLDFDLRPFLRDSDLATLRHILDDNGMEFVELEFLSDWWKPAEELAESNQAREFLLTAAKALRARSIKVSPNLQTGSSRDLEPWIPSFIKLCDEAAEVGTTIAIEFMPFSNVPNLKAGLDFVQAANHPAGGLFVDIWHVERSGTPLSDLARVQVRFIKGVEVDDGLPPISDDMYQETIHRRALPGEGEFDVSGYIQAIVATGWAGPWGVEILSEEHRVRPLGELLPNVVQSTLDAFEKAGIAVDKGLR